MLEFITGLDFLGVGAVVGAFLLMSLFVWFIIDDRPLEDLNRRYAEADAVADRFDDSSLPTPPAPVEHDRGPQGPAGPRRAA